MLKEEFPGTKFLLGPGLHRVAPGVEEVRGGTPIACHLSCLSYHNIYRNPIYYHDHNRYGGKRPLYALFGMRVRYRCFGCSVVVSRFTSQKEPAHFGTCLPPLVVVFARYPLQAMVHRTPEPHVGPGLFFRVEGYAVWFSIHLSALCQAAEHTNKSHRRSRTNGVGGSLVYLVSVSCPRHHDREDYTAVAVLIWFFGASLRYVSFLITGIP